ncbi:2-dehydropantoate 2-reductase [Paracoccus aminophilus]|uniref:2-dehydropantoate 2-reductase n=1 Tax=Paracoccus aminophilus JCM 7686 TaxID=1367847 RepID=S5XTD9_PARAH|nr:2-dehydropantoate 2-reductase [Paracoccus aminophilus]AGT10764.1 2-dehydropantoate 2-reductase [Paracoccus aminophilus JCM 7686]
MRLLVVGAGSTGGYFGGRLAEAGRDVTFLVRPRRAAQLRETGLRIRSPHGDADLVPQLALAEDLRGPYDAILLTVKGYALQASLDDIAPAVGPDTIILPVLNGMRHIDLLTERFGAQAVGGGLCRCSTTLGENGEIIQLAKFQDLVYGELSGEKTARIEALDAFLQGAGFEARLSPDIAREMWGKWFFLSSLAAATCLMRGTIGEIAAVPGGASVVEAIVDEAQTIISAAGVAPSPKAVATAKAQLTEAGSKLTSSMFRDLEAGLAVEAVEILGDLVARGEKHGISAPLLTAAYVNLAVYAGRQPG